MNMNSLPTLSIKNDAIFRRRKNSMISSSFKHTVHNSGLILYSPYNKSTKENLYSSNFGSTIYSPNMLKKSGSELKISQCETAQSQNAYNSGQRLNRKEIGFVLPNLYTILANKQKQRMKEYYESKKEINTKYENMINNLLKEETEETYLITLKNKGKKYKHKLDEIKKEYELTRNLLQQQRLIEEEELVKKYKQII